MFLVLCTLTSFTVLKILSLSGVAHAQQKTNKKLLQTNTESWMSNWHFTSPAMTRRIWLLWKYRFLAVVRCQAVWALALPLDYISDVDLWLGESGCRGNSFLAVVRCQAVWALAHSLGYISDVDRGACCMGNSLSSISPLSGPALWRGPSSAAAKWPQWDITTVGVALPDPPNWESLKWE